MTPKEKLQIAVSAMEKSGKDLRGVMNMLNYDFCEESLHADLEKAIEYIHNSLEIAEDAIEYIRNSLLNTLQEVEDCEACNGTGEVMAEERIHGTITDIPYKRCPECGGTGMKQY